MILIMFESFVLYKCWVVFMSNYHMCGDDTYIIILYCDVAFTYIHVCMLGHSYILYIPCINWVCTQCSCSFIIYICCLMHEAHYRHYYLSPWSSLSSSIFLHHHHVNCINFINYILFSCLIYYDNDTLYYNIIM